VSSRKHCFSVLIHMWFLSPSRMQPDVNESVINWLLQTAMSCKTSCLPLGEFCVEEQHTVSLRVSKEAEELLGTNGDKIPSGDAGVKRAFLKHFFSPTQTTQQCVVTIVFCWEAAWRIGDDLNNLHYEEDNLLSFSLVLFTLICSSVNKEGEDVKKTPVDSWHHPN